MKILVKFLFLSVFSSTCWSQILAPPPLLDIHQLLDKNLIFDSTAFLEGADEALNYSSLAIRSIGDPDHLSSCDYNAYKRYGVKLEMTGDIIIGIEIFDRNKGFNSVMKKRIRDSIPNWADSIGISNSTWIQFDSKLMNDFLELFEYQIETDSTVLVTLIPQKIPLSTFKTLDGIVIRDIQSKTEHTISEFVGSVTFQTRRGSSIEGLHGCELYQLQ